MPPVKQQRAVPMNIDMRVSLWRIYLATGTAAVTAYFLVPDNWWQTGTGAAIGLAAVAGLLVGIRMHRPRRPGLWWMLAAGLSGIAAGDFTYALYERALHQSAPFPSLADALYHAATGETAPVRLGDREVCGRPAARRRLARGLCLAVAAMGEGAGRGDHDRPGGPGRQPGRLPPGLAGRVPGGQPAAGPPATLAQVPSDHPGHGADRRPQRGRADPGDDRLRGRPGLPGTDRGPGRRQRLHRRDPGRGRGVRRGHRPAGPLHQRAAARQEPRPQHRLGRGRNRAGHHLGRRHAVAPPGRPPARGPSAERPARRAGRGRVGAGPQQPRQPLDPHAGMGLLPRDRVGEADAGPLSGHAGRPGRLQPLPDRGGGRSRGLARRHRRGHRLDLAAHASGGARLLRAVGGRLYRRPGPGWSISPASGPGGPGA